MIYADRCQLALAIPRNTARHRLPYGKVINIAHGCDKCQLAVKREIGHLGILPTGKD